MKLRSEKNDLKFLQIMIEMYCEKKHKRNREDSLCQECKALWKYAQKKIKHCPLKDSKSTCRKCHIHCYKPPEREQIKAIMRYSAPRLLYRHPLFLLKHFFSELIK